MRYLCIALYDFKLFFRSGDFAWSRDAERYILRVMFIEGWYVISAVEEDVCCVQLKF